MDPIKITVIRELENQMYFFKVRLEEKGSVTEHSVTLNKADYNRITNGDIKPELLIEKAFEFLLEHEPKEQILSKFDFTVISRYFPTFNKEIRLKVKE